MAMNYPIPDAALNDRLAVVGTSGSGKTYLTIGAMARLLKKGERTVGIDPLGVMWGLRLSPDGKSPSPYKIVIFGGPHGDLPLTEHVGALIGETVATTRESCLIDLSDLGTKAAERRFMLAFLTALYRHNAEPVHLIIDEADMFAPQRLLDKEGDAAKLQGMMETVVRRGRAKGFIPWLITQRPAVLSKDVLSQADGIVALKLTSSQDRDAIGGWIEGAADRSTGKEILASLPAKKRGEGVLWIPGRGILDHVAFPSNSTYDSSRAPRPGEKREDARLKPLDLGRLKERLASVEEETKSNDPRALKAEIARLKAETAKFRKSGVGAATSAQVEKINTEAEQRGRAAGWAACWPTAFEAGAKAAVKALAGVTIPSAPPVPPPPRFISKRAAKYAIPMQAPVVQRIEHQTSNLKTVGSIPTGRSILATDGISNPQRRILASIGFWASVGQPEPSRAQVAGVAGYSPGSGGFNNLLGALRSAGMISIPSSGRVSLADGALSEGLSRDEAAGRLRSVLTNPQAKLVDAAMLHPQMTREELAAATGYAPKSGGFNNLIGALCTLTVFEKPEAGCIAVSNWAREVLS